MKLKCKTPKAQLKCTHCDTTGRHNTNDYCKEKQKEFAKEQPGKAKANKVDGRDDSPIGGDNDKTEKGKANLVDATEEGDETDSSDEYQWAFAFTVEGVEDEPVDTEEEKLSCSVRESLKPTPRVAIRMAMSLSKIYQTLPYLPCLACPDTGTSCNIISEKEAKRMCLRWAPFKVALTNASNSKMRVTGSFMDNLWKNLTSQGSTEWSGTLVR